jgi:hypothetical protein
MGAWQSAGWTSAWDWLAPTYDQTEPDPFSELARRLISRVPMEPSAVVRAVPATTGVGRAAGATINGEPGEPVGIKIGSLEAAKVWAAGADPDQLKSTPKIPSVPKESTLEVAQSIMLSAGVDQLPVMSGKSTNVGAVSCLRGRWGARAARP